MINCNRMVLGMIFLSFMLTGALFAQGPADGENEYRLAATNLRAGLESPDTLTSDAGRGVAVASNPDLDNDGYPELIVTEYQKGGRVFVYEMIGNDLLEFVWASPPLNDSLSGGGSTPRSVTTGDFDNNGMQEIIFPVGHFASDSFQFATRGIYFYEFTGTDNDYGSEPAFRLTYEAIDSAFATANIGRTESGLRVQDIDGDGKSELLFPPRQAPVFEAKLYILEVESGTFQNGDAIIEKEYIYEGMVQPAIITPDSYTPAGTDIGDVDGDGLDEIIVAGWTTIASGAGLGFIQIDGPDQYTDGSVIKLADYSAFVVKANPIFAVVNDQPVVYLHGTNAGLSASQMWILSGVVADNFVSDANITELYSGVGFWSAWALGDQDHPTESEGDGLDLYLYGGGGRLLDIEYSGSGAPEDTNNYSITQVYDLRDAYDNVGGLFNDIYTYPGMDLDKDGLRDIVASYKGSGIDTLGGVSLASNGFHLFFWEWGDSSTSITPGDSVPTSINPLTVITPDDYKLAQNYPNPFNPTTKIEFTLPINKEISLAIYNSLGQKVRTLINNERYAAGSHILQWDATDNSGQKVASGVYIYKLTFGNFSKSMKMTLLR